MPKRTYWTKLNHDEARLAIDMMDDAEVGRWFRGFLAGSSGKEYLEEKVRAWPLEMRAGLAAGRESFRDAETFSQRQRDRVSKRYQTPTEPPTGSTAVTSGITSEGEKATESLPIEQRTTNIEHPPYPPEGDGRGVEMGETEKFVVSSWDAVAHRYGFPAAGPWTDRRRKALRALVPGVGFQERWSKAVRSMMSDSWAQSKALPIDYLLKLESFERWASVSDARKEPARPPPPAREVISDEERAKRQANKEDLLKHIPKPGRIP